MLTRRTLLATLRRTFRRGSRSSTRTPDEHSTPDLPDSAAVELRKTIEAAAAEKNIEASRPIEAIQKMIGQGLITNEFGDALHHVRQIGNVGAHHGDERVDAETAERIMRFTTLLLQNAAQHALFNRHLKADEVAALRAELEREHLIVTATISSGGRPRILSFALSSTR